MLLPFAGNAAAVESIALDLGTLDAKSWKLDGVKLTLSEASKPHQQLALTIAELTLPKPFDDFKLADLRCTVFSWDDKQVVCKRGKARIASKRWRSPEAGFSFRLGEKSSDAKIAGLRLFGGTVDAELSEREAHWQVKLKTSRLDAAALQQPFGIKQAEIKAGTLAFDGLFSGEQSTIGAVDLNVDIDRLSLQSADGNAATEALSAAASLHAVYEHGRWQWRSDQQLTGGALYWAPIYLEAGQSVLKAEERGVWHPNGYGSATKPSPEGEGWVRGNQNKPSNVHIKQTRVDVEAFRFEHEGVATLNGRAALDLGPTLQVSKASLSAQSGDLQRFTSTYLLPFTAQTPWEGLSLKGRAEAELTFGGQALTNLALNFEDLAIDDAEGRIRAEGGKGSLHWSSDPAKATPSTLAWQSLSVFALPFGAADLTFSSAARRIELLRKTRVPMLGGHVAINKFNWQSRPVDEPNVYFEGRVNNVSLERLTGALDWTPLSGTISGKIPGVEYRDKTLKLGGALNIKVFDGNVTIANLASSGLFGDFPKLSADVEVDRLDLEQLTGKFQFGGITGRLSGYVKNLLLENWRPVGFYAWFGTPDDDDSRHRISQKAVKNIANIGGGGASDLLSRSFLSVFETFGYDKIGLGCHLHDGVCQMSGVEAAQTGYRIIKGGGLPRIDVIGYNPHVDWSVLLERLKRITTSDEVIIK